MDYPNPVKWHPSRKHPSLVSQSAFLREFKIEIFHTEMPTIFAKIFEIDPYQILHSDVHASLPRILSSGSCEIHRHRAVSGVIVELERSCRNQVALPVIVTLQQKVAASVDSWNGVDLRGDICIPRRRFRSCPQPLLDTRACSLSFVLCTQLAHILRHCFYF